ncbi:hypothetical protein L1987_86500 [Smallanthus sonchifolius]|uniref:Uncharacterized protein n=1 Tax=Smallanthus sonchifolius TaxID=185202 RepID=A0ACB8Y035_9ASTR|nr:hypothetical protein L1987_86500 [Smallanthus sonchifolius]
MTKCLLLWEVEYKCFGGNTTTRQSQMAIGESCSQASLTQGASRSTSEAPPAHYILNIQQFSALTKHNVERYESNEFEAGGYKWMLVIHPNGNKSKNAGEFLSVYLAMADTTLLAPGWEVYAAFRIFLLDQNNDSYLKVEDERTNGRRFHRLRTQWGFDQFISLKEFADSNNGYLLGDNCVFGAEVYVLKERSKVCQWKVQLYSNAKGVTGGYISLKLALAEPQKLPSGTKILAEFTIRILDQLDTRHYYGKASYWFSASKPEWGWQRFITHGTFFQTNRGLLFKDVCCIEVEVEINGETTVFG